MRCEYKYPDEPEKHCESKVPFENQSLGVNLCDLHVYIMAIKREMEA